MRAAVLGVLIGTLWIVGVFLVVHALWPDDAPEEQCIEGALIFHLWEDRLGRSTFMGELVLCGAEISGVYGPSLEYWVEHGMSFDEVSPTPTPDWVNRNPGG